jgi:hypothetical protein
VKLAGPEDAGSCEAPLAAGEPDPAPTPPFWFDGPAAVPPDSTLTRWIVIAAKAPAATTKIAVAVAAAGLTQPKRGLAWPGRAAGGRNLSTADQKNSRAAAMAGTAQPTTRTAATEYQAPAVASESSGGRRNRSLIRSRPSPAGSTESAAECRARRSSAS